MNSSLVDVDAAHIWHPYSAIGSENPIYPVKSAKGVRLKLMDGRELIDGMSSWWCVIHGYNHPTMNAALTVQLERMAHVMFGGLTHEPAMQLTEKLLTIVPSNLDAVFYSDSGSVSVEVALKMALQYWRAKGEVNRQRFLTVRGGYHGDTFGAMSVCDPDTGMHSLFTGMLPKQVFVDRPVARFGNPCEKKEIEQLKQVFSSCHKEIAAVILEPIVQGAGGMWFYSADYLRAVRALCDEYHVLLILDEIATGFGRTGRFFACEHAGVKPDIMCIGKALTGGYLTLAATLTTQDVHQTIKGSEPGVFMHGPTFMANPLACSAALASIRILLDSHWQANIARIAEQLEQGLAPCRALDHVQDVRVLGAIGVVELKQAVDMLSIVPAFVDAGVWVRPFGKLVYLMPPYIINTGELEKLTSAVCETVKNHPPQQIQLLS